MWLLYNVTYRGVIFFWVGGGATETRAPPETRLGGTKHPMNFGKDRNVVYGLAKVRLVLNFSIHYVLRYRLCPLLNKNVPKPLPPIESSI